MKDDELELADLLFIPETAFQPINDSNKYGLKNETNFQHGLTETYKHYYNNIKNEII